MFPIFLVLLFAGLTSCDPFSYQLCASEGGILDLRSVNIEGDPIVISPTTPVKISFDATVTANVSEEAVVSVDVHKGVKIFGRQQWIPIPCIDGYGSCSLSSCDYFKKFNTTYVCPLLQSIGKPCTCPPLAGDFVSKGSDIKVDLSAIPSAILKFADGDVKVHVEVKLGSKTIFCMDLHLTIKLDQETLQITQKPEPKETVNEDEDLWSWDPFWYGRF